MVSKAELPQDYIDALPDDRKQAVLSIREAILTNLPDGFQEVMSYGMLGYKMLIESSLHLAPIYRIPYKKRHLLLPARLSVLRPNTMRHQCQQKYLPL
jgi:hypothetical protein